MVAACVAWLSFLPSIRSRAQDGMEANAANVSRRRAFLKERERRGIDTHDRLFGLFITQASGWRWLVRSSLCMAALGRVASWLSILRPYLAHHPGFSVSPFGSRLRAVQILPAPSKMLLG